VLADRIATFCGFVLSQERNKVLSGKRNALPETAPLLPAYHPLFGESTDGALIPFHRRWQISANQAGVAQ
jgi:hypothetical protein